MLVPKLTVCMIHLFNSNAVKFNFLTKLSVASVLTSIQKQNVSFFAGELEMKLKFKNGVILSKFDRESSKVNQVIFFSAPTSIPNMKALAS